MVRGAAGTADEPPRRVCADGRATGRQRARESIASVEENVFAFVHAWLRQDATSTCASWRR